MKRISILVLCLFTSFSMMRCDTLQQIVDSTLSSGSGSAGLSNDQIISGLKQALTQGTTKGVKTLAVTNGFFKNAAVKVLFPPEAQKVEKTLRDVGLGQIVDVAVEKINRAAEDAAVGAKDIFVNSIKQMTVKDAMDILMGADNAATNYLRKTTSTKLFESFSPVINNSLNKVGASNAWTTVMTSYNKIPLVQKINPDLNSYVTNKAMDGVFYMIEKEERLIRKDPVKRVTEVLKQVFALQDKK